MIDSIGTVTDIAQKEAKIVLENKTKQGDCQGIPVIASHASNYVDANDIDTRVVGHCEMFNLSDEKDRETYADLVSKLMWSPNMSIHFEERVLSDNALIVYITYLEYIKIAD